MEEKVLDTVYKYNIIKENDNIVLGLSGGPDSMALLYILLATRKIIPFNLVLAHVNHGVRGDDAVKDEMFVKDISNRLNLAYFSTRVDMVAVAKEEGISAEEAGRKLRYGFFREIIKKLGSGKIAVAHNKNDQAETLIMRIMRGTGIDGLKGMEFQTGDIIRPILNIGRLEIEKYIEDNNIPTVLDKTNLEPIYTRNKVRLELIPYIEKNFNPNIIDTLFRLSENATLDTKFLDELTVKKYDFLLKKRDKYSIVLNGDNFVKEDIAIQRRIVRKTILDLLQTLQGIEEIHVSSVVELFNEKNTGKRIDLPGAIIARVSYENLIIEKTISKQIDPSNAFEQDLKIGNNVLKEHGLEIYLEILDKEDMDFKGIPGNIKYFDYNKIVDYISIRTRKNGDKFNPLGMKGRKKLKDYFIDEKVPRELRGETLLLVDRENIIWVIGYRTSELYKINHDTRKVLRLEIKNIRTGGDI